MIPEEILERVKDASNIVEVVGQTVRLKKAGANHKGLCPFHKEKSPSFTVHEGRQIFKCFGCGEGGNVFTFLTKSRNITFPEAVRELAQAAGIEIPEQNEKDDAQAKAKAKERDSLFNLMDAAADWFCRNLKDAKEAAPARDYVKSRGVTDEISEKFRIGFAPRDMAPLVKGAAKKGWSEQDLEKAGLIQRNERGGYGRFRSRLMFPIEDASNRVVGFGGRVIGQGEPKYLNSPETSLFKKSHLLYGLPQAKPAMLKRKQVLLVEGYMDAIACHQAGIDFAVAGLGTALTADHSRQLKRYVEEVYLVYDTDRAGVTAARRGSEILLDDGLLVKVVRLGKFKDPDDFLKAKGPDAFLKLLPEAMDAPAFFLEEALVVAMSNHEAVRPDELALKVKVDVMQGLFPLLAKYATNIESGVHLRDAAARLGLPPEQVQADFEAFKQGRVPREMKMKAREVEAGQSTVLHSIEVEILRLLINHRNLLAAYMEKNEKPSFSDPDLQFAGELLWRYPDQPVMSIELKNEATEAFTRGMRVLISTSMSGVDAKNSNQVLEELLLRWKLEKMRRRKAVLDIKIQNLESPGKEVDGEERIRLMAELQGLGEDMERVKAKLAR